MRRCWRPSGSGPSRDQLAPALPPGYKILARLASGELDLSHAALDAVADLHRNATGHITALLTALGAPARTGCPPGLPRA
jgi:hypothetical protein